MECACFGVNVVLFILVVDLSVGFKSLLLVFDVECWCWTFSVCVLLLCTGIGEFVIVVIFMVFLLVFYDGWFCCDSVGFDNWSS